MSEYVEARYAKLMLQEANAETEGEAAKLVNELLQDLGSPERLNSTRAQALASIRSLALSLDCVQDTHSREWDAANQAAEAWCKNAFR
jgi:hypothetical protein